MHLIMHLVQPKRMPDSAHAHMQTVGVTERENVGRTALEAIGARNVSALSRERPEIKARRHHTDRF